MSSMDSKKNKQKWNDEEDEKLRQLVASVGQGTPDWVRISQYFSNRTPKQCRERWSNHVSPRVEKGPWSLAEELVLFQVQALQGNRWKEIAQYLHGRSESCVKNRYYSALRRVMRRRGVKPDIAKELMKEHFMPGAERTLQLLRQGCSLDEIYEQQKKHLTPDHIHGEFQSPQAMEPPAQHDTTPSQSGAPLSYVNAQNLPYQNVGSSGGPLSMPSNFMSSVGGPPHPYHSHAQVEAAQGRDTAQEIGFVRQRVQGVELGGYGESLPHNGHGGYSGRVPVVPQSAEAITSPSRDKRQGVPDLMNNGASNKQRRVISSEEMIHDTSMNDSYGGTSGLSNGAFSLRQGGSAPYYKMYDTPNGELITGAEAMRDKQSAPMWPSNYEMMMSSSMSVETNPSQLYSSSRSSSISWAESLQQHPYPLQHNKPFFPDGHMEKMSPSGADNGRLQYAQGLGVMQGSSDPCTHPEEQ